jgi:translation initiation factor IF-3
MDFGKYKYEQNKKLQKARKKQHVTHLKEVKLRPKIEEHDYRFKVNNGRRFLELHDKVKFTVTFRGREMAHTDAGFRLLEKVVKDLEEVGQVENAARLEGRNLVLLMVPRSTVAKPLERRPAPAAGKPATVGAAKGTSGGVAKATSGGAAKATSGGAAKATSGGAAKATSKATSGGAAKAQSTGAAKAPSTPGATAAKPPVSRS